MYTTDELLAAAKRSEFFPVSQSTLEDADLIAFANEEMLMKLVPKILSVREEFFITTKLAPIVGGIDSYSIPERALGNSLKDVFHVPNTDNMAHKWTIPRISPHDANMWSGSGSTPAVFYLMGDEVVLLPMPSSSSGALLFMYPERPNKLVATTSCAKITGITLGTTCTLTVDTDMTASLSTSSMIDLLSAVSPYRLWNKDVAIISITSTTIEIALADAQDAMGRTEPKVGDWICPAQQSPIPMVPSEFHSILAEMICFRAMKAIGHTEQMQAIAAHISELISNAFKMIANRVESEVEVAYDNSGLLNAIQGPVAGSVWNY
jgi:hypothetical protein